MSTELQAAFLSAPSFLYQRVLSRMRFVSMVGCYSLLFVLAFEGLRRSAVGIWWFVLDIMMSFAVTPMITIAVHPVVTLVVSLALAVIGVTCAALFVVFYITWVRSRPAAVLGMSLGFYLWICLLGFNLLQIIWMFPREMARAIRSGQPSSQLFAEVISIFFFGALMFICLRLMRRSSQSPFPVHLTQADQPELWQIIEQTAASCGVRLPEYVYWLPIANAQVMLTGRWLGIGGKRALGIGLPLLRVLSVDEFRATLAHEFHHIGAEHTLVFSCIFGARRNAGAIDEGLLSFSGIFGTLTNKFLNAYQYILWRLSGPVVRQWEFEADSFAAEKTSPQSIARALVKRELARSRFELFRRSWIEPVLESGFLPPIINSFWEYYSDCALAEKNYKRLMAIREINRESETHPTLRARLLRVMARNTPAEHNHERLAFDLVHDPDAVEEAVYRTNSQQIRERSWNGKVLGELMSRWEKEILNATRARRGGVSVTSLQSRLNTLPRTAEYLGYRMTESEAVERLLVKSFSAALWNAGWEPEFERGRLIFRKGEVTIDAAAEVLSMKIAPCTDWNARCDQMGISTLVLVPQSELPTRKFCSRCLRGIPITSVVCPRCGKILRVQSESDAVSA
jgi:Zn-dependent protease with chaperone function